MTESLIAVGAVLCVGGAALSLAAIITDRARLNTAALLIVSVGVVLILAVVR